MLLQLQPLFLNTVDVVPIARLEAFRALKLSRLKICRALKFQSLPDMVREPYEYEYIIHIL